MWLGSWLNCITSLNGAIRHWFAFKFIFQQKDYVCSIFVSFTMEHSLKIQGGKIQTASLSLCLYKCQSTHHRKITAPAQDFFKDGNAYLASSFSIGRSTTEELEEERRHRKKLAILVSQFASIIHQVASGLNFLLLLFFCKEQIQNRLGSVKIFWTFKILYKNS